MSSQEELVKKYTRPDTRPQRESVFDACRSKDPSGEERVLEYIQKGGCLTECDEQKMTLLHHCAFSGNVKLIEALLKAAPQKTPDIDAEDAEGWTPLHYAADRGHMSVVQLLCDEGANVNAKDTLRRTPLHLAALGGKTEVLKILLGEGASKNAKNIAGFTAKDLATTAGHTAAAEML